MYFFNLARKRPARVKTAIIDMVKQHLGPNYDVATHFTPKYNPWDQRLCLVPDADLFEAIKTGAAYGGDRPDRAVYGLQGSS